MCTVRLGKVFLAGAKVIHVFEFELCTVIRRNLHFVHSRLLLVIELIIYNVCVQNRFNEVVYGEQRERADAICSHLLCYQY